MSGQLPRITNETEINFKGKWGEGGMRYAMTFQGGVVAKFELWRDNVTVMKFANGVDEVVGDAETLSAFKSIVATAKQAIGAT